MSKVFQSSSISKILSTNKPTTVEVNNDNIIESDSEFREVIKKGYLLTQINLSTIPDIIQEAIDKAILDAKTQTLADSLISTMRQSIENFEDGVYKKTYIDTTITYLEELLTQKASPEIVAAIAEAKITVATAEFATTSQVGNLSSRVGNSESEIINIKETINTKDTARATQIEELQASINQNLSNYSDVIELYIDADGNIRSQKIENLEAKNSLKKVSITELNQVVLDEAGNYSAIVANAILDSDGKIVGFTFSDTNELTTFTINADVFRLSNSTNTRTPFRIEDNELFFDGKVTFSNITDKTSVVTIDNVQDAIKDNVTTIDGNKIVTSEAFVQNLNATGGVVADSVRADTVISNDIYGSTITGVNIIGAKLTGAVVKASYLDLDGELEVLTNYHITLALYNSNPSLYTDAVFISADNEYRIPSISMIKEPSQSGGNNQALYGVMRSYNIANAGNNLKAVKIRPTFQNLSGVQIANISGYEASLVLKINGITLGTLVVDGSNPSSNGYRADFSFTSNYTTGFYISQNVGDSFSSTPEELFRTEKYVYNLPVFCDLKFEIVVYGTKGEGGIDHYGSVTVYLAGGSHTLPFDWTAGKISIHPTGGTARLSGIQINNMI